MIIFCPAAFAGIRPTPTRPYKPRSTSAGAIRRPAAFDARMDAIRSRAGTIDAAGPAAVIRPRPCALVCVRTRAPWYAPVRVRPRARVYNRRYAVNFNILYRGTITPQHLDGNYSLNRCLAHSCCNVDHYNDVTGEIAKTAAAGRPKEPPPYKFQVTRGTPRTTAQPQGTPPLSHNSTHFRTIRHLKTLSDTLTDGYTYLG